MCPFLILCSRNFCLPVMIYLFSAYFHEFHRNLSFGVFYSNSYNVNDISIVRPCFSAWHSTERSPAGRQLKPARTLPSSMDTGRSVPWSVFFFLLCSIYPRHEDINSPSISHGHQFNADISCKRGMRSDLPGLKG